MIFFLITDLRILPYQDSLKHEGWQYQLTIAAPQNNLKTWLLKNNDLLFILFLRVDLTGWFFVGSVIQRHSSGDQLGSKSKRSLFTNLAISVAY
jgi:hypothetical protein